MHFAVSYRVFLTWPVAFCLSPVAVSSCLTLLASFASVSPTGWESWLSRYDLDLNLEVPLCFPYEFLWPSPQFQTNTCFFCSLTLLTMVIILPIVKAPL